MLSEELSLDSTNKILANRYYLHRMIAQSNHSRIFLATDLAIGYRKCAIKQLYPSYCPANMQSKIESEFLHEVEISKMIAGKHHQICQYYNYLIDSGRQYLIQEWIEGTTLEDRLHQKSSLTESATVNILLSILLILKRLHSLKIVHNDLKPSNIILRSADNLPVLIDFGIARQINVSNQQESIVGTPGYMSVEQAMGKITVENDLYSLGLIAIYLLTGRSPQLIDFNAQTNNFWHQTKVAFNSRLVATIDRAIAFNPEKRFSSASEMIAMLKFPQNKLFITPNKVQPVKSTSYYLYFSIALAILSSIWLYIIYLKPFFNYQSTFFSPESVESELLTSPPIKEIKQQVAQPTIIEKQNNALTKVIFVPDTPENEILEALGEPTWRKPGFWANSVAWSYEDIIAEGFDLGYIFDRQTKQLRQAEIALPAETDLSTVQSAMNLFLTQEHSTVEIEQGLQAVYQYQKKIHHVQVGNLKGIIQRNHQNRIYMAVWSADFH